MHYFCIKYKKYHTDHKHLKQFMLGENASLILTKLRIKIWNIVKHQDIRFELNKEESELIVDVM